MAGITDGKFCREIASYGFDMVTIGGYNADKPTIDAGCKVIARGRLEFDIKEDGLISTIKNEASIIKDSWNGRVSVNLRAVSFKPIIQISKLENIDVVELNAHCRQPEIMDVGGGQALLNEPEILYNLTKKIVERAESKVSVKIRANVPGVDYIRLSKAVEDAGADYLHVDAMKPGHDCADYEIIRSISKSTEIFLIGNNSIKDLKSARNMIDAGADGISIARATIGGFLPFDLSLI
ncbi:MAG: hypothetical protein FJ150_04750 [Euryarchaeota archaeon]|nr:hypothetical protein [Euryarchaeota archaeon]